MTKRKWWLAAALVIWLFGWGTVFFVSRHAFTNASWDFGEPKPKAMRRSPRCFMRRRLALMIGPILH